MNTRLPTQLALLCALIIYSSTAPLLAQQQPLQTIDGCEEYPLHNLENPPYVFPPESPCLNTSPQNNLTPRPVENAVVPKIDPSEEETKAARIAVALISPLELHFVLHRLLTTNTTGFDVGLHGAYYIKKSVFYGWNGFDFAFRLGHIKHFSILARLASLWTLIDSANFNIAAGFGGEIATYPTNVNSSSYPSASSLLSLRFGIATGPIAVRTEYDFHMLRNAHNLRAYLPLPYKTGIGMELDFNRDNRRVLNLNHIAATFFLHF